MHPNAGSIGSGPRRQAPHFRLTRIRVAPRLDAVHGEFGVGGGPAQFVADVADVVGDGAGLFDGSAGRHSRHSLERNQEVGRTAALFDARVVVERVPEVLHEPEEHERQGQQRDPVPKRVGHDTAAAEHIEQRADRRAEHEPGQRSIELVPPYAEEIDVVREAADEVVSERTRCNLDERDARVDEGPPHHLDVELQRRRQRARHGLSVGEQAAHLREQVVADAADAAAAHLSAVTDRTFTEARR